MRKLFILLVSLLITLSIHAQYQSVIGNNNTSWVMNQWLFTVNSVNCVTDSTWVDYSADTNFQSLTFKAIKGITSLDRNVRIRGFIKEDITTGEVLYRHNNIDTSIYKIMDMSLNLNDTFMVNLGLLGSVSAIVDSVYYMGSKKVIRLDYKEPIQNSKGVRMCNYTMIEGVGVNLKGVNYNMGNAILDTNWTNNTLNYQAPRDSFLVCNLSTGISDFNSANDKIIVYPNPASQNLWIQGVSSGTYFIHDSYGKEYLRGKFSDQINISSLEEGIYIITVNNQLKRKFIVLR